MNRKITEKIKQDIEVLKQQKVTFDNVSDSVVYRFIFNNSVDVLLPYVAVIPQRDNQIPFQALRALYLLDKDIRIQIYNVLEEIETSLKSVINAYVKTYNLDLSIFSTYQVENLNNYTSKLIYKIYRKGGDVSDLYFSEIYTILSTLDLDHSTNRNFLNYLAKYFLKSSDIRPFLRKIESLYLLRNTIAHHDSIIIHDYSRYAGATNHNIRLKHVIHDLNTILNNIRHDDNQSRWLARLETFIWQQSKETTYLLQIIGYHRRDFKQYQ